MRITIRRGQSVSAYLGAIREKKSEYKRYQHAGLQNIRRLGGSCAIACEFQSLLVVQPEPTLDQESIFGTRNNLSDHWINLNAYALMLQCNLSNGGFTIRAYFDSNVFPVPQAETMLEDLEFVLSQFSTKEDQLVDHIQLSYRLHSDSASSNRCRSELVDHREAKPKVNCCLHEAIQKTCEQTPGALAIKSWDGELSYEELDNWSLQLALRLRLSKVGPEVKVALLFEKSMMAIVAMLAVMRSGGVFVSLDPRHPPERLCSLLEEIEAGIVLCSDRYASFFIEVSLEVLVINSTSIIDYMMMESTIQLVDPKSAMYLLFTSGSTGRPKGCVIEHSACYASLTQLVKSFKIDATTRLLQFSSYGFDGCILEIFAPLLTGGCVCVPSEEEKLNSLVDFVNWSGANFAFFTPAFSRIINPNDVPTIITLVIGGERVEQEDINRWMTIPQLYQAYGPTETCVMCVVLDYAQEPAVAGKIGKGIIGTLLVIDGVNQIAPCNTVGELYIGGPNLAREYFRDPERTALSFQDHPDWAIHSKEGYSRYYKTGDMVRMGPDGLIEYLGRKDTQIKLRGQRIELQEVENHLRIALGDVVDLAVEVVTLAHNLESQVLVAFILLEKSDHATVSGSDPDPTTLLSLKPIPLAITVRVLNYMHKFLPEYMVPGLFLPIKKMPLTKSAKIDRRRLQRMASELTLKDLLPFMTDSIKNEAPLNETETILQALWAEALNMEPNMIGLNDSFVCLGGDSIIAMRLVAAARERGLKLNVANIFQNPTLSGQANSTIPIEDTLAMHNHTPEPFTLVNGAENAMRLLYDGISQYGIFDKDIEDIYPCTPFQESLMALSVRQPGSYVAQQVFKLQSNLIQDLQTFQRAWQNVVQANTVLRTVIIPSESAGLIQVVIKRKIEWSSAPNLEDYIRESDDNPMGFGSVLARYGFTINGNEGYFVWTMHHAVYDAWSISLILKQLEREFGILRLEYPMHETLKISKDLPLKFSVFVESLKDLHRENAEAFWRDQFAGEIPQVFPQCNSGALYQPTAFSEISFNIPKRSGSNQTLATIIRAAWALVVSKYASSHNIVFGMTLSGRTGITQGMDQLVGPTVTTVPVRIRFDPLTPVNTFLAEIQSQAFQMVSYEQFGLTNIRQINQKTKAACDFQSLLVIQPQTFSEIDNSILGPRQNCQVRISSFDTYPLTMECVIDDRILTTRAIFDPLTIHQSQMQRILFQLQHVIQQLNGEETAKYVQQIDLLSPQDLVQIWKWNASLPPVDESCVHTKIQLQAQNHSDSQAVCSWDGDLTYGDLDRLASRLASYLMKFAIHSEVKVPIFFSKSKWAVVAIFGIIKTGAAFVPLEASHPPARLEFILQQVEATVVLCSAEHRERCSRIFFNCNIIVVDEAAFEYFPEKEAKFVETVPKTALYVTYTSGSSGIPKGIVIEHGSYCSSARDHAHALDFNQASRRLQFASYSFDTGIEDILSTLLTGGCICIPSEDERIGNIAGAMKRMNVTTADLTPSFTNSIRPEDVPNLRSLVLGGEPLTSKLIKTWASRLRLINAYGTSECSVTNLVQTHISVETDPANIGFAVGGCCWIVDAADHDKLVPVGCVGELLIEGPVLARGYLDDHQKTGMSFIDSPQWAREVDGTYRPRRLYKTGDLVRYAPDGSIIYIGRKDSQIKLRGQRVEVSEVEHHLIDHPSIRNAVVLLPSSGPCADKLTAIIEPQTGTEFPTNEILTILQTRELQDLGFEWSELDEYIIGKLPVYMIPTSWVAVTSMPLHTSKKLDRSKIAGWLEGLPSNIACMNGFANQMAPSLAADEDIAMKISVKIADIVSKSASNGRDAIAGHDVRLSGAGMDSINIATLANFISKSFGVNVRMQQLIDTKTTVRDIAKCILAAKLGSQARENLPQLDLMREFQSLSADFETARKIPIHCKTIFLTGATGLLGTQILRQLLGRPDIAAVITLVRASSSQHAMQRIEAAAQAAKWYTDKYPRFFSKIQAWSGDLAQPGLGLNPAQWQSLQQVDAIIHNGASIQWNADYHTLKHSNVSSTMELLKLCVRSKPRPDFVYVSGGQYFEDGMQDAEIAKLLASAEGYSQTKFVSEMLVKQCMEGTNRHISIIRPGLIIGTAREGVANTNDFLWRIVAGAIRVQAYPIPAEHSWLSVSSSDRVARAVMSPCLDDYHEQIVNISDGIMLRDFWEVVDQILGHDLRAFTYEHWIDAVQKDIEIVREKHPLWPVMHMLHKDILASNKPSFQILEDMKEEMKRVIQKNVEYLASVGFFPEIRPKHEN